MAITITEEDTTIEEAFKIEEDTKIEAVITIKEIEVTILTTVHLMTIDADVHRLREEIDHLQKIVMSQKGGDALHLQNLFVEDLLHPINLREEENLYHQKEVDTVHPLRKSMFHHLHHLQKDVNLQLHLYRN